MTCRLAGVEGRIAAIVDPPHIERVGGIGEVDHGQV
jgi:hypothetical protein